jgi:predicted nucleic-acid-binding protein
MQRVDANVILRYLLDDHAELSARAAEIMDASEVYISTEVLCEVVYVLGGVYNVKRDDIGVQLADLIQMDGVSVEHIEVLLEALSTFARTDLDFVDTILFAHHRVDGADIATFDKQLERLIKAE